MISVEKVVENIRILRVEKEYCQDYLAHRLKISQNAYSKLELNKSRLTVSRLLQIAIILECDVSKLLKDSSTYKIFQSKSPKKTDF